MMFGKLPSKSIKKDMGCCHRANCREIAHRLRETAPLKTSTTLRYSRSGFRAVAPVGPPLRLRILMSSSNEAKVNKIKESIPIKRTCPCSSTKDRPIRVSRTPLKLPAHLVSWNHAKVLTPRPQVIPKFSMAETTSKIRKS